MNSNSSAIIIPPTSSSATAVATNDIRPLKDPVHIPSGWGWLGWTLLLVVVVTAATVALLWWRKKRTQTPPVIVVPPHVRAKNKLANALALLHDPRQFCILVSDTLRLYLEERFNFHAPERTTEEFLLELHQTNLLTVDQKQRLAEFLERCDLVKFARFEPTETELRALLEAALRLIDETQYVTVLPPAAVNPPSLSPGTPPAQPPTISQPAPVTVGVGDPAKIGNPP